MDKAKGVAKKTMKTLARYTDTGWLTARHPTITLTKKRIEIRNSMPNSLGHLRCNATSKMLAILIISRAFDPKAVGAILPSLRAKTASWS